MEKLCKPSLADEVLAYLVDVAGTDGEDDVAGAGGGPQGGLYLLEAVEEEAARDAPREVGGGYAAGVRLARGVYLREVGDVGALELLDEVLEEGGGAGVGVGLEHEYGALVAQGLDGVQQGLELAGMVGVVVVDVRAVILAFEFEAPPRAVEAGEAVLDGVGPDAEADAGRRRGEGVLYVVDAGYVAA